MGTEMKDNKGGKKKTPVGKIILFVVEILALIALLVVLWVVLKVTDEDEGVERISIKEEEILVELPEEVTENVVMKGYRNIALFGVDSRVGDLKSKTRSDTIMVASINNETHEVKLVSVYRDTYLNQMGTTGKFGKCNASYAYGGAEQAIKMLNANLDLDITDFVTIGFEGVRDVVDALGGVYIDVDSDEIKHLNNYQTAMVSSMDDITDFTPVEQTGYQLLNGLQAMAYCRIRYTAGADFKRTERQREVVKACLDVAKTASYTKLKDICENVFGEVYTSFELSEILEILSSITEYSIVEEGGFPTTGQVTTGDIGSAGSCVIPVNLETNVKWLHSFLFEEDYEPSGRVKEYSQRIFDETNPYLTGASN